MPGVSGAAANREVARAAAAHLRRHAAHSVELASQTGNPGTQIRRRRLQAIDKHRPQSPRLAGPQGRQRRPDRPCGLARSAVAVHGRRAEPHGGPNNHRRPVAERADRFDNLAPPAANRGAASEKKRHVAAQLGGQGQEPLARPVQFPAQVCGHEGRGGVARSAAQPGGRRNSLHQPQRCRRGSRLTAAGAAGLPWSPGCRPRAEGCPDLNLHFSAKRLTQFPLAAHQPVLPRDRQTWDTRRGQTARTSGNRA